MARHSAERIEAIDPSPRYARLERLLETERALLETLLFKLTQAKLVLSAQEIRFVSASLQEVELAMEDIREAEDARAGAVVGLATELGLSPGELTLDWLAANAPEPMRARFSDLRYAFLDLTREVERVSTENPRLASAGRDAIDGTLRLLYDVSEDVGTYDRRGRKHAGDRGPARLDRPI